jgi:hypothetical protein
MTPFELTPHSLCRLSQRGIRLDDLELVPYVGTEVEGGFFVRQRDFQRFEQEAKRLVERARKLVGKRVVVEGERLITGYHACESDQRRLLRTAEQRNIEE